METNLYLPIKVYSDTHLLLATFLHKEDAKAFVEALRSSVCPTYADGCFIKETAE